MSKDIQKHPNITPQAAVNFVSQCENTEEEPLKTFLSQQISELEHLIKNQGEEAATNYLRVIEKGLRLKSKQAAALRYFYYGYYVRQQEEQVEKLRNAESASKTAALLSRKHYPAVLKYLFENGCSQQKTISASLGIDRSNLSRYLNELGEAGLVTKSIGPKCVFYELSPAGYAYVREHTKMG